MSSVSQAARSNQYPKTIRRFVKRTLLLAVGLVFVHDYFLVGHDGKVKGVTVTRDKICWRYTTSRPA